MRARGSSAPPTSHDKLSVKTLIETSFDREVKTKSDEPKAKVAEYPPKVENQPASCHGLSLQLIVLLRFEANFEFQKCAVTSSSFRRYRV